MKNKLNQGFMCGGCSKKVLPAQKTSRNHCPYCFLSKHVDGAIPGDRATDCGGKMIPISYFIANGAIKIDFLCVECGKKHRNKLTHDDEQGQLDNQIKKWKEEYKHLFL